MCKKSIQVQKQLEVTIIGLGERLMWIPSDASDHAYVAPTFTNELRAVRYATGASARSDLHINNFVSFVNFLASSTTANYFHSSRCYDLRI